MVGTALDSITTGKPGFAHATGTELFDFLTGSPAAAAIFNEAMTGIARQRRIAIASYDFSGAKIVVDVGGGHGALIASVLQAHPAIHGILFDLPKVISGATEVLDREGVADRCDTVAGDFFEALPEGGDVYLLGGIICDWEDAEALAILRKCRAAVVPGGRIILVELVLPTGNESSLASLYDLNMMVVPGGRLRNAAEYRSLLAGAGLDLLAIGENDSLYQVVEAAPT